MTNTENAGQPLLSEMRRAVTAAQHVAPLDPVANGVLNILKASMLQSFQSRLITFISTREWPLAVYNVPEGRQREQYTAHMLEFLAHVDAWLRTCGRNVDIDSWQLVYSGVAGTMERAV